MEYLRTSLVLTWVLRRPSRHHINFQRPLRVFAPNKVIIKAKPTEHFGDTTYFEMRWSASLTISGRKPGKGVPQEPTIGHSVPPNTFRSKYPCVSEPSSMIITKLSMAHISAITAVPSDILKPSNMAWITPAMMPTIRNSKLLRLPMAAPAPSQRLRI